MWPRITFKDVRIVCHYLGSLLLMLSIVMLIPCIVAFINSDLTIAINYFTSIGITVAIGVILSLAKVAPTMLKRKQAVIITALAWITCSLAAAIPLYLSGHFGSYLDSFFEAVSGFTTTGFTMTQDLEHLSVADNLWRFILQFIGGQGVLVIALSFGAFAKSNASSALYDAEGRHDHVIPDIKQTTSFIWRFSILVIIVGTVVLSTILLYKGMDVKDSIFNGLCITIGTYDTGGFSTTSQGILYYHCWPLEIASMFFMILGAINFGLYGKMHKGRTFDFFKNIEVRTLALWMICITILLVMTMCAGNYMNGIDTLLRKVIFSVVSASANVGYQIISANQLTTILGSGVFFIIGLSMAVGGMSDSTSGGIKALRLGIVFKVIIMRIKQVLSPDKARMVATYTYNGKRIVTQEAASSALVIVVLYIASYVIGAVVGVACGYDAVASIFESISATANAGFSSGIVAIGMPLALKILYIIQMILGRLEFITILAFIAAVFTSFIPNIRKKKE